METISQDQIDFTERTHSDLYQSKKQQENKVID
jgi:hypothetical protein